MTVPIATSPGRSGGGPQLALSYDSGARNGPFGFGWNRSLPSITRKTDIGLLQYRNGEDADVSLLSGAENLVPVLGPDGSKFRDQTTVPGYVIRVGVDLSRVSERNRGRREDPRRLANRYPKRIRYGNTASLLNEHARRPRFLDDLPRELLNDSGWMFEVVFDYDEHDANAPTPRGTGPWTSETTRSRPTAPASKSVPPDCASGS